MTQIRGMTYNLELPPKKVYKQKYCFISSTLKGYCTSKWVEKLSLLIEEKGKEAGQPQPQCEQTSPKNSNYGLGLTTN